MMLGYKPLLAKAISSLNAARLHVSNACHKASKGLQSLTSQGISRHFKAFHGVPIFKAFQGLRVTACSTFVKLAVAGNWDGQHHSFGDGANVQSKTRRAAIVRCG